MQKPKSRKALLKETIPQRRVVFYGGLPRFILPKMIKGFFEDTFGPVEKLLVDQKRVRNGNDFKVKIALTDAETWARRADIAIKRRKVHLNNFPPTITICKSLNLTLAEIRKAVSQFGNIEEISYIVNDTKGKTSCFIIFREEYIMDRLADKNVHLRKDVTALFGHPFTPM